MDNKHQIFRLSNYRNILYRLKSLGFIRFFSDNIADTMDISASQVRKDFSAFNIKGNQKGGYYIDEVLEKTNEILGKKEFHKIIIAGVGRIGQALMQYKGFHKENINIAAGFDININKINEKAIPPILHINDLKQFVQKENIRIGIITVPDLAAQQVFELLLAANIIGILNFTAVKFKATEGVIINSINIEHELENLIYFVNNLK